MTELSSNIKKIDLYLLDQLFKGKIQKTHHILDAGCGSGRNLKWLLNNGYQVKGIDPNAEVINTLRDEFSKYSERFVVSTIEKYNSSVQFDFIICNAVLHFAKNHHHFDEMMTNLVNLIAPNGTLFIRMTTDIGIENLLDSDVDGVHQLPDQTTRYLITRNKIEEVLTKHQLKLAAPIKTVVVDGFRSMGIFVFSKQ